MILVTGGTGLLGSHLLVELARSGEEVLALKRPSSQMEHVKQVFSYHENGPEFFERIAWEDADLSDYLQVADLVADARQIYHCAACLSSQPKDATNMIRFNVESTAHVVNACLEHGNKRLLHVSSSSAIGKAADGLAATEANIWAKQKDASAYSISKFKSEMEVWRGMEEGLQAIIVNPVIILGAGFWHKGSSSMMDRVARGMKYGTPGVTGYVGVEEVVRAMTGLMNSQISGERFILSAGNYSYAEMLEMMAKALGKPRQMKQVSPSTLRFLSRLDGVKAWFTGQRSLTPEQAASAFHQSRFDASKAEQALGWKFRSLEEIIPSLAQTYLQDQQQRSPSR